MYKVKALVKKTMGLLLATLVAFGVTAGTTQAFAGSRAATVKPGELKKNDKNAKQLGSQLTTNSSENQSSYEYTDAGVQEPYMKDAEIHVYSVKDDNGKAAADINITYKNAKDFCSQFLGVREYTATAKEGWVFKNWTYKQLFNGKDYGNYGISFRSFSQDHDHKTTPYTSGEKISVNRTGSIFETAFKKRIYKVYANLNPTIKATAGVGGSITSDGEVISTTRDGRTEVPYGVSRKYTFTANEGYVIYSLKVDGEEQTVTHATSGSYTFPPVKSPHTIEVSFAKAYTVTYTDGVDGKIFKDQVTNDILSGADTPKFNGTPSREGYEFTGWNPTVVDKVTDNAKYVAQWKRIQRTVTFMDGNKTHATVKVETGKAINTDALTDQSMPTKPTKAGYTFKEWNTKENGEGQTFTGASLVNGDTTVYAIYTQDSKTKDPKKQDPKKQDLKTPQPKSPAPAPKPTSTPPTSTQNPPAPAPGSTPPIPPAPTLAPKPQPLTLPKPEPGPDPKGNGNNNGSESVAPESTDIPELNIGGGNGNNANGSGVGGNANNGTNNGSANVTSNGASVNANGSSNGVANRSGSAKSQATGARSADALPNTGSNASGITFAFFGAMVFGMFAASGAAANCKRAKHLR